MQSNTALYSGGGIYVDGLEMTMNAPDSWVAFNTAQGSNGQGGYGGGIQVVGSSRDGHAYIGSPGVGNAGPVYGNEARYGGGISVMYSATWIPRTSRLRYSTVSRFLPAHRMMPSGVSSDGWRSCLSSHRR